MLKKYLIDDGNADVIYVKSVFNVVTNFEHETPAMSLAVIGIKTKI